MFCLYAVDQLIRLSMVPAGKHDQRRTKDSGPELDRFCVAVPTHKGEKRSKQSTVGLKLSSVCGITAENGNMLMSLLGCLVLSADDTGRDPEGSA